MGQVILRYRGFFNTLKTYHRMTLEKREQIGERLFAGVLSQTDDPLIRKRIIDFTEKEGLWSEWDVG